MKIKLTFICALFTIFVQSQELETIELLSPETTEYDDLLFLKEELKGKQLLMLGEITHMYGNIFEMKARVIEYLHKELGYTTIAMESSMYDIWRMNKTGFSKKEFNNSIWGVWSDSQEFQRLVNYIEKNNLKVIGFDSQVNNASKFTEDFFKYLKIQNIKLQLNEDDLGIVIEEVLENVIVEEDDINYPTYEKELKRIIKEIKDLPSNETNYYWKQFSKNLLANSEDAYYNKEEILTTDFGNKNDNIRDKQMADNLLSYINRNPNEKIICWADNIHIINNNSSIKKPVAKEFISMGSYIKKELKSKVYSLATIHSNDSLLDTNTKKWHSTPIKNNSFEEELLKTNKPYLFITSNQEKMKSTKNTRLLNFIDFTEARLDELHDGYIYIQNATHPKKEIGSVKISNKKLNLEERIKKTETKQKIILKGQIIDKESNEPISFANLILKEEEIYRVADERGSYELPVETEMLQKASISISSVGYKTETFLLKELHSKVYLEPKFEVLEEVVVTGYLSPATVLKKAILNKKINHPVEPFNFQRYAKVLVNKDDATVTSRIEQVKWNENNNSKRYQTSAQLFAYREDAIRYASILHKRKYAKFKLNFVKLNNSDDDSQYIISFQTERNKSNYTNRRYPTKYSGEIYISKENFALLKVIENWETTLTESEIKKYFDESYRTIYESYKNVIQTTIKEENICYYSNILGNDRYYATKYFNRTYNETLDKKGNKKYEVIERDSRLFDFELKDVEEIEYYEYNDKKENSLYRVDYNKSFWDSFYKRKIDKN